jgi:chromosome segregation ATPase
MADDPTKDLTDSEKLNRILADLADVKTRLGALESTAEDRSRDTRPKLDLIIKELSDAREEIRDVAARLDRIEARFETLAIDVMDVRTVQRRLGDRVSELERRPN